MIAASSQQECQSLSYTHCAAQVRICKPSDRTYKSGHARTPAVQVQYQKQASTKLRQHAVDASAISLSVQALSTCIDKGEADLRGPNAVVLDEGCIVPCNLSRKHVNVQRVLGLLNPAR